MSDARPRPDVPVSPDAPQDPPAAGAGRPDTSSRSAIVKRRWRVFAGAGGGAAVIAVAGAIALGNPDDQGQSGDLTSIEQATPNDRS